MNTFKWIFKYVAFKLKCIAKVQLKILMSQFCRWNNFPIIFVYVYTIQICVWMPLSICVCLCVSELCVCIHIELYIGKKGEIKSEGKSISRFISRLCLFFYFYSLRFRQCIIGCWLLVTAGYKASFPNAYVNDTSHNHFDVNANTHTHTHVSILPFSYFICFVCILFL